MSREIKHLREFGKFRLDVQKKVLWYEDRPISLPLKEIELLCVLTENDGEVVTKDELLERVWADSFIEESNLSRHVYRLRKAFVELGESEDLIQTIPRRGYRFTGEVREPEPEKLVIERHSVSRTLIEALDDSEPSADTVASTVQPVRTTLLRVATVVAAAVLLVVSGTYFYQPGSRTSLESKPIKSIAVLPLTTVDQNGDSRALSLGFADALITTLSKNEELRVISTNAISQYTDSRREPLEIGKELGVDAVLEGTLQRANSQLRVTLRLVRTADRKLIWTSSFDESEKLVFHLQDVMADQTARALTLSLKPTDRTKLPTQNLEAYNLYLQGQYHFRRRETSKGGGLFKQATELDPSFAQAWSGLAASYAMGDWMSEAETTVNKALALDPNLAEAHAVRGFIKMFLDWDWPEAEKSLKRAIQLDPNSVEAHHWLGVYLSIHGRFEAAKSELKQALELHPVSPNLLADLGQIEYFMRDFEQAEVHSLRALSIDEEFHFAKANLMAIYAIQGREKEAFALHLEKECGSLTSEARANCERNYNRVFSNRGLVGLFELKLNAFSEVVANKRTAPSLPSFAHYSASLFYLRLGDHDKALSSLRQSIDSKARFDALNFALPYLIADPAFDPLRDHPDFEYVVRKMRLEAAG